MNAKPISDWWLEQYLQGDCPPERAEVIRVALEQDPELQARLQALEASNRDILFTHPPAKMADKIARRAGRHEKGRQSQRFSFTWAASLASVVVVVAALFISYPYLGGPNGGDSGEIIYTKGLEAHLVIFRKLAAGNEQLNEATLVRAGDVLQLSYVAGAGRFGVIVSLDGNGTVTRHYPARGKQAVELNAQGAQLLDFAYELDDAPDFERFFFVTSEQPFAVQDVLNAAQALTRQSVRMHNGALALPDGLASWSLTLPKP